MAETLAGTIDQMPLLEILKLLNSGKMSGRLKVTNSYGKGELYVNAGEITHCVTGSVIGESALSTMLCWIEGHFSFEAGIETPEVSIETPAERLLSESAQMIKNWQSIKAVVSSMDIVFALSSNSSSGAVNLQAEEWQILAQVNGTRSVGQIMEATGKDEFSIAKILFHLHSVGLLEKTDKTGIAASPAIDEAIFDKIENELTKAIGPMAEIIIDEAIEDLAETRNSFSNEKVAALVEKVSSEISDENKRLQFSQVMIELLKKL